MTFDRLPFQARTRPARRLRLGRVLLWAPAVVAVGLTGCAGSSRGPANVSARPTAEGRARPAASAQDRRDAEAALAAGDPSRAVALFGRYLADPAARTPVDERAAYLGLGQAHEQLGDCGAAVAAYDAFLDRHAQDDDAVVALSRRGACQAELEHWEASAASFGAIAARPALLHSVHVEALARQGYALFSLGRYDEADAALRRADALFVRASDEQGERFANLYFVGMARFYRAAIVHARFREVEIAMPESAMKAALEQRMELLTAAQAGYNHTIEAKHVFWVSAAGYQLGHILSEFHDALMYAPVPEWLGEDGKRAYYRELRQTLKPIVAKAIWVYEKNLETARRLGYETPFIAETAAKLAHLEKVLGQSEGDLGEPEARLAGVLGETSAAPEHAPPNPADGRARAERRVFVPGPTPL